MPPLASFNGGPSEAAVQWSFIAAAGAAALAGLLFRSGLRQLAGGLFACVICAGGLIAGNQRGDASGLFLVGALAILCPIALLVGVLVASVTGWGKQFFFRSKPAESPSTGESGPPAGGG